MYRLYSIHYRDRLLYAIVCRRKWKKVEKYGFIDIPLMLLDFVIYEAYMHLLFIYA